MAHVEAARQFSFRLPEPLVARLEHCLDHLRSAGLDVNRADVVRLLLNHALETADCDVEQLLHPVRSPKRAKRRRS